MLKQTSALNALRCESWYSPEVEEPEDETGEDSKIGEVETEGRSGCDGERNVVTGTNGTVKGNGPGDDDVTDSAESGGSAQV
jgi:hypothetical protein